jgi:hypothetical protein
MIEVTGNKQFDEQAEFYASLKVNLEKIIIFLKIIFINSSF